MNPESKTSGREPTVSKPVEAIKLTSDWNADQVDPQVELRVDEHVLVMDIYLNYAVFENVEGDKAKIRFIGCSEYSHNTCNDEGYYYGQYRTNPNELPWGEFYEIVSGLDRHFPEPIIKIRPSNSDQRHFIFFFKDETFECLADSYELEFYHEK